MLWKLYWKYHLITWEQYRWLKYRGLGGYITFWKTWLASRKFYRVCKDTRDLGMPTYGDWQAHDYIRKRHKMELRNHGWD